jgi:hypothetical protein
MKNVSNFLVLRRRAFAVFFPGIAFLLLILVGGLTSCEHETKHENIQEILLKDKAFQEFVTADYFLKKQWLDGDVKNPEIKSMSLDKFGFDYDRAATNEEKAKVLQDFGYVGNLTQMVDLLNQLSITRDRFIKKFPNVPLEELAKAVKAYERQELGKLDYSNHLKIHKNEK